jgi:hypothetical protein
VLLGVAEAGKSTKVSHQFERDQVRMAEVTYEAVSSADW